MMLPPLENVDVATDEEIIESYVSIGMARDLAEIHLRYIRDGSDEFEID